MPTVKTSDLFTNEEIQKAQEIKKADEIVKKIITPEKLEYINEQTGQENDPLYLAYLLLFTSVHRSTE